MGLAQQWDQLDQLGMRMQHNLEQQIQARNQSGVSEDALKEFSMMFKVSYIIYSSSHVNSIYIFELSHCYTKEERKK